jgi:hypothetical protein
MGAMKKTMLGTAITLAGVAAIGTVAAYAGAKSVKKMVYPPSVRKYLALAALPFALSAVYQPERTSDIMGNLVSRTHMHVIQYMDKINDEAKDAMQEEISSLKQEKDDLESLLKKSQESKLPDDTHMPAPREKQGEDYLNPFVKSFSASIYIDAKANKFYVLKSNGTSFYRVAEYPCTTGKNPLPKSSEGDFATPQGIFLGSAESYYGWSDEFGDDKIRINLPEEMGSGIIIASSDHPKFIYAARKGEDVTNGGIVISSNNFSNLKSLIGENDVVPVAIFVSEKSAMHDYTKRLVK